MNAIFGDQCILKRHKLRVRNEKKLSYFSTKTYVVGTQKTVSMSAQNIR